MANMDSYFSVLALFILFRETIEASIICGVLLQFLNRSKPGLKRAVWYGVAAGVGVSIIFGVIFIVVYYTAQNNLFKGKKRDWFKGIISWIAGALITILGFAMLRFLGWEEKWRRRLQAAVALKVPDVAKLDANDPVSSGSDNAILPQNDETTASRSSSSQTEQRQESSALKQTDASKESPQQPAALTLAPSVLTCDSSEMGAPAPADAESPAALAAIVEEEAVDHTPPTRREMWKIFALVFTTVVREGIESVVFLGGLSNVKLAAIPLPAFVGITAGVLMGVFLFYTGRQVKHIKWLIISMAVIIFFIAAGQVNLGTDALIRAGLFGYCSPWYDERPWFMVPLYDWSACCNDLDPTGHEPTDVQNRRRFFALARAIFGYQDKGTPLEIILYCVYWFLMICLGIYKYWRGTLFDADFKYKREQKKLQAEAEARAKAEALEAEAIEAPPALAGASDVLLSVDAPKVP